MIKQRILVAATLTLISVSSAFANTVKSQIGYGPSEPEATAEAKNRAEKMYGDRIVNWGRETCAKKSSGSPATEPKGPYDVPKAGTPPVYACEVEFTVKD